MTKAYRDKLKTVGTMKGGRVRHNQAGVPIVDAHDTRRERITVDENGSVYKDNKDGTQDLTLNPKSVGAGSKSPIGRG